MLRYFKFLVILAVLIAGSFLIFVYSGITNVAATSRDSAFMRWTLSTIRRHSIESHLNDIKPPALDNPELISAGAHHYHEMCERCHLAPGIESSDLRDGLNPRPPILAHAVQYSTPEELFWIIKHGIKMTGMPAWGKTHDDRKIWAIVAFLERLPHLSPTEYQSMILPTGIPADAESHKGRSSADSTGNR